MTYDLAIIGSGFAGLMAFKKAKEKGLNVCLITKDGGASQHFSGAFDIIDPRWRLPHLEPKDYPSVRLALDGFILAHPHHVYAKISENHNDFAETLMIETLSFFDFYNIPILRDEKMVAVFGSTGRVKPSGFALSSQALRTGEINDHKKVVYIEFPLLKDYPTNSIVAELKKNFKTVQSVLIKEFWPNRSAPLASLLNLFDQESEFNKLKEILKKNIGDAQIVVMPPVLGIHHSTKWHQELESYLNVRVVELLSVFPSASGMRIQQLVQNVLKQQQATVLNGQVVGFEKNSNHITNLIVQQKSGDTSSVQARSYILASGKYLGGGIQKGESLAESIFHLPLTADREPVSPYTPMTHLIHDNPLKAQTFLDAGVRVNHDGSPVDHHSSDPVFANLKAAGHVLTGFDFTRERCGFGVSMATALQCFL